MHQRAKRTVTLVRSLTWRATVRPGRPTRRDVASSRRGWRRSEPTARAGRRRRRADRGPRSPAPARPPARHRRRRSTRRRSSATSVASSRSDAASSLKPKSIIHTCPSSPRNRLARRRSRWAMRWARSRRDLLPDGAQHLVGELVGATRRANCRRSARRRARTRSARPSAIARNRGVRTPRSRAVKGEERLVLDRPAQRGERSLVAEVAAPERAVHAEQEVGAALVGAERLDEVAAAVGAGAEVRRRPTGVDAGRRRGSARGRPADARPRLIAAAVGRRDGAPRTTSAAAPAAQPASVGLQRVEREGRRHEAGPHQADDGEPTQPPPPPASHGAAAVSAAANTPMPSDRRERRGATAVRGRPSRRRPTAPRRPRLATASPALRRPRPHRER